MDELILKKLLKRGKTEFRLFRSDFPMTTEFGSQYDKLLKLELIETVRNQDSTDLKITPNGIKAHKMGIKNWVKENIYFKIKNNQFYLTKDTLTIENEALIELENEGFIRQVNDYTYKIIPINKNDTQTEKSKDVKTKKKSKRKENIKWLISMLFAILAIIEHKYHLVVNLIEFCINMINK